MPNSVLLALPCIANVISFCRCWRSAMRNAYDRWMMTRAFPPVSGDIVNGDDASQCWAKQLEASNRCWRLVTGVEACTQMGR